MKGKLPGLITLLVTSEILGLLMGQVFFHLYGTTVPSVMTTGFNKGAAHAAFLVYGLGAGFVVFLWGLLAVAGARFFGKLGQGK